MLARRLTLALVVVLVLAALAFDIGFGTPSAFGIGEFFLLCPLGGLEAMLASSSFIPAAALSVAVVLVFTLVFGRAWCAWGCPAPPIRNFFKRQPKNGATGAGDSDRPIPEPDHSPRTEPEREKAAEDQGSPNAHGSCSSHAGKGLGSSAADKGPVQAESRQSRVRAFLKRLSSDKRTWVLLGVLALTFFIGLPIFCLVCPIGLTFGTVSSLWHLVVDKQLTASVVVFPLVLVIELVIYRKWCANLCPIAGLLNVFGNLARPFRPRVDASTCLIYTTDKSCNVCTRVCAENINLHSPEAGQKLGECTRCGECVKHCPAASISIEPKPETAAVRMREKGAR